MLAAGLSGTVPGSLVGRGRHRAPRVDQRGSVWGLRGLRGLWGTCLCLSRAGPPSYGPVLTRVDLIANVKLLAEAAELYPAVSRPARRQLREGGAPPTLLGGGGGGVSDLRVWVRDRRTDGGWRGRPGARPPPPWSHPRHLLPQLCPTSPTWVDLDLSSL